MLPDLTDGSGQTRHLAVGAGKDANIYVVDRDNMGKFDPSANHINQEIKGALGSGVFSMPAYFNNTVYYGAPGDHLKAFAISNAQLASAPGSQTGNIFPYPGTTPSISANGTSNAILWAVENSSNAVLHAYDAANLANELYNSNQASGGRDQPGIRLARPVWCGKQIHHPYGSQGQGLCRHDQRSRCVWTVALELHSNPKSMRYSRCFNISNDAVFAVICAKGTLPRFYPIYEAEPLHSGPVIRQ